MSDSHITRYDKMPIPPVEQQTEYFDAGAGTRVEAEAARIVLQEAEAAAAGP